MSAPSSSDTSALRLSSLEFQKAFPREYLLNFLQRDLRPDGRLLLENRPTSVFADVIQSANSSATAQRGGTVVTCGIKLEVGAPTAQAPADGRFVVNVNMSPLAFASLEVGKPSKESLALSELLSEIVLGCNAIQLRQLGISSAQAAWVLYADLVFLSFDGNALDVCLLALMTALDKVMLPSVEVDDEGIVTLSAMQSPVPLVVSRRPRCFTFGCIDQYLISDPSADEESMLGCTTSICYSTNATGELELCGIHKLGGAQNLSSERLREVTRLASEQAHSFRLSNSQKKASAAFASPPPAVRA